MGVRCSFVFLLFFRNTMAPYVMASETALVNRIDKKDRFNRKLSIGIPINKPLLHLCLTSCTFSGQINQQQHMFEPHGE